jgi:WD40 repeat protein
MLVLAILLPLAACGGGSKVSGDPVQPVTGSLYQTLRRHNAAVTSMAFSPDGKWLASCSMDKSVIITDWNSMDKKIVTTFAGPKEAIAPYPLAWTPDQKHLLVGGDCVHVFQTSDWKEVGQLKGHSWVYSIAQAKIGGKDVVVTTGGNDMSIRFWDAGGWKELREPLKRHEGKIYSVAFNAAGTIMATGSWDRTVKLFKTDTWEVTSTLTKVSASVFSIAFRGTGLIVATENGDVKYWEMVNPLEPVQLADIKMFRHSDAVPAIAQHPQAGLLATGGFDKWVYLYDSREGGMIGMRRFENKGGRVFSLIFSPDGKMLAAGSEDGSIRIWQVPSRPSR